ncbi:sulfate transporter family-domain-containing protein [Gloeopeniophorella convolvens]|nr:sulfate transporter family-domain-containing protein [Gloeopeniophorella convolvens]
MPPSIASEASSDGHTFVPLNEDANAAREHDASPRDIQRRMTPAPHHNGSPLSRAGLLQPRSVVPSHANFSSAASGTLAVPRSQNDIRAHTMQLSGVPVSFSRPSFSSSTREHLLTPFMPNSDAVMMRSVEAGTPAFIFPTPSESRAGTPSSSEIALTESTTTMDARPLSHHPAQSNLTILMARHGSRSPSQAPADDEGEARTPVVPQPLRGQQEEERLRQCTSPPQRSPSPPQSLTEHTPLLPHPAHATHYTPHKWMAHAKCTLSEASHAVPAVILGALLNVLDGVSYGMIMFPATGAFADLGAMGVSMFFVSTVVAQLIYSAGASGFAGANGSMMIEVVPFFHILATHIAEEIGEDRPQEIVATTLVAFAFSSLLTGLTFFLLGFFRLGSLIGFFPRHILVGCIGGVGVFLIITGLNVSTRLPDDEFSLSLVTLRFFLRGTNLALWTPAFALAALLRVITARWHHQLILPIYFLVIPVVFYIIVLSTGLDLGMLRKTGWLFEVAQSEEKWYNFYTYFSFSKTQWGPLWATLPTQFALLFFNILHPPLNVPALAVSLDSDVDTNKELVAHGYSNFLAGLVGTVPNYLVYVNTLLFYRVGGTTRISGFMLAGATFALLLAGTGPIAYIPVMVVGALIFVLGIDLYITIVSIMIAMTVWDFVIGVLFGIIVSCIFFVVQNSQRRSIRAVHTGETTLSTVRRPSAHREYLREVSRQTTETIRELVAEPAWTRAPMRFLVLDFALVLGVDLSAAEAFVRVQRLLAGRRIVLVFCGARDGPVLRALNSVGLFDLPDVELFATYNHAMEWTENAYLRAWFDSVSAEAKPIMLPGRSDSVRMDLHDSLPHSPRRAQLRDAGYRTMARDRSPTGGSTPKAGAPAVPLSEALVALEQAFLPYAADRAQLAELAPYFEREAVPVGHVLWQQGESADGLCVVGAGVLRATYRFTAHGPMVEESMVPGTLSGELSGLAGLPRNSTVTAESPAVLWHLRAEALRRLETERPELSRIFTTLVLKAAKLDFDILLSALATRQ